MEQPRYRRIGIIGALEKEVQTIFDALDGGRRVQEDGLDVVAGTLHGIEVAATVAGMGTVNAAAATQSLICRHGVEAVIFSGIAGGLNPALHIEDVVIGERLRYLDTDVELVAESAPGLVEHASTPALVDLAEKVLAARGYLPVGGTEGAPGADDLQYLRGTIATGDRFVTGAELKAAVTQATHADCVEMEGAAIAHIAAKNGVDCLILRAISDNCDEDYDALSTRSFDLETYAGNASAIVLDLLAALS